MYMLFTIAQLLALLFCVNFSRERKFERIEKKFKRQNSIPSFVLLNNANGRWQRMTPDLGQPLVFAAAAGNVHKYLYIFRHRRRF